jgi:hypothetical protein
MDPTQSADAREPHTNRHRYTGESDGAQHPTVLEENTPPGKRDQARKPTPEKDTGLLSGKSDDVKSHPDARQSQTSSLASVRNYDTMNDMDTPLSQRD